MGQKYASINSSSPGGYGGIHYKTKYWTDRGYYAANSDCNSDCYPHLSHWGYYNNDWPAQYSLYNFYMGYTGYEFTDGASQAIYAKSNLGCAITRPFCMFQQQMATSIVATGNYYISGYMKKKDSFLGSDNTINYNAQWILSHNRPTYAGESCEDWSTASSSYKQVNNLNLGSGSGKDANMEVAITFEDTMFNDWQYVEKEIHVTDPHLNWFSINVDASDIESDTYAPYFAFDNLYISDQVCTCPIIRLLQNKAYISPFLVRAQNYIRAGYNVGNLGSNYGNVTVYAGDSGKTIFRAGNYISLEPGFEVKPGAVFETQLRNCYDSVGPITVTLPNAYSPNCDNINDEYCFYPRNATSYTFDLFNEWGQEVDYQTGQILPGQTKVCLNLALATSGTNLYLFYINLYGCNNEPLHQSGDFEAFDASEGCYSSSRHLRPVDTLDTAVNENISDKTSVSLANMNVYPNPACEYIEIEVSDYSASDKIVISGADGKAVMEFNSAHLHSSYQIGNLSSGVYTITYSSPNFVTTKKFTKICQ
jgi:hypothetical protein